MGREAEGAYDAACNAACDGVAYHVLRGLFGVFGGALVVGGARGGGRDGILGCDGGEVVTSGGQGVWHEHPANDEAGGRRVEVR